MQCTRSWSIGVLVNRFALKEGESCHQMAKGRESTAHPCMCPWYLTCCKAPLPLHLPLWTAPVPKPQIPHTCTTAIQTLLKPPPLPIHVLTVYSVLTIAHRKQETVAWTQLCKQTKNFFKRKQARDRHRHTENVLHLHVQTKYSGIIHTSLSHKELSNARAPSLSGL